jgi:transposase InsO family protein
VLPVEKRDSVGVGNEGGSAPLGGDGGAARQLRQYYRKNGAKYVRRHPVEVKLKAVRLYLEEGMPTELVAKEVGVSCSTISWWLVNYRKYGEAGLRPKPYTHRRTNTPDAVGTQITAIKKNNPHFGSKRISQILRRIFLLKASPETVRKRLKKVGLVDARKKARKTPEPKIHFFERTAPNETWQTDITIVNILGRPVYIIGFIDDYSRYIVGCGVFRSQTAENVMEVYRTAVAQYGPPKEMLTDNGRQYANWRGMTKFQKELKKDKVHHIRSQPHHPQTLGKIERFWKSLKEEFLDRARFDTFEEMQERTKFWIKYYNHKRTHQGIDGVCPADRYFSVQNSIRQVIAKGVEENVQELALRGVPTKPFYMVGQMGEESVVIRSDKGKLRMMVGGEEGKEMVYDLKEKKNEDGRENGSEIQAVEGVQREGEMPGGVVPVVGQKDAILAVPGDEHELGRVERLGEERSLRDDAGVGSGVEQGATGWDPAGEADRGTAGKDGSCGARTGSQPELKEQGHEDRRTGESVESGREMPGSAGDMDGTQKRGGNQQGNGGQRKPAESVAGSRDGRDTGGAGTASHEASIHMSGAGEQGEETAGQKGPIEGKRNDAETGKETDETAGGESRNAGIKPEREEHGTINRERSESDGKTPADYSGPERPDESHGGGGQDGSKPQDLLQVGAASSGGDKGGAEGAGCRAAWEDRGHGEGSVEAGDRGVEERVALAGAEASHP